MTQKALACPLCRSAVPTQPFKTWQFGSYKVRRYRCKKCDAKFNLYQRPGKSYTIPKPK